MSKKRDIKPAETKAQQPAPAPAVYTGPVGLHPITDTAFEVRAEGRDMGGFLEYFAPDVFADCDMSEAVCRNFDETPALNLQPGDTIGFSTPDGETAIPFKFTTPPGGWHFDPAQGKDIRTIRTIKKLYAPKGSNHTNEKP